MALKLVHVIKGGSHRNRIFNRDEKNKAKFNGKYHLAHFVGYFDLGKRIDLDFLLWNEAWLFPSDGNFNRSNKVFLGEEFDFQGYTLCVQIFLTNARQND